MIDYQFCCWLCFYWFPVY